ncbi:hypothetical protein ACFYMK_37495, partial [Streptomyces sp. NPDC007355]
FNRSFVAYVTGLAGRLWPAESRDHQDFETPLTDHPTHKAQGSMIRRYIIWRNKNATDKHLKALVSRANAA